MKLTSAVLTFIVSAVSCHCPAHTRPPMRKLYYYYCRLGKTQEKILVCHTTAVASGGLSKRVTPRTKTVIFSSRQKVVGVLTVTNEGAAVQVKTQSGGLVPPPH